MQGMQGMMQGGMQGMMQGMAPPRLTLQNVMEGGRSMVSLRSSFSSHTSGVSFGVSWRLGNCRHGYLPTQERVAGSGMAGMQGMDMSQMANMQGVVMMPLSQVQRARLCKVALRVLTSV